MEYICLDKIEVRNNLIWYYYTVSNGLKCYFRTNAMFIEYEEDMSNVPTSILTIPFVSCMAGLSWLTNCMLFVDELDRTFYESFSRIKNAYQELFYYYSFGGILVPSVFKDNIIKKTEKPNSLLLFGGGIDCHCSFLRHRDEISQICNIYGRLKSPDVSNNVDNSDKIKANEFAKKMGVVSHHVRSSFSCQFNGSIIHEKFRFKHTSYWYSFLHSMAFISLSAPICYKNNLSHIIIGSSFAKGRANVKCGSYITTDSEFRFAKNGVVFHDAFELNRQQKVKYLVDYQKSLGEDYPIQACSFNDHNCCECEKCFRTIIEIVAENGNPKSFGFNINGSLKKHWERIVNRDVAFWGVGKESYYYDLTRQRMRLYYDSIQDKEFVDWFLSFDFHKAKRDGKRQYYRNNLFSILKRKLHL